LQKKSRKVGAPHRSNSAQGYPITRITNGPYGPNLRASDFQSADDKRLTLALKHRHQASTTGS
jgi:hypothetical protein